MCDTQRQKEKRNSLLDFIYVEDFGGRMIRVMDFFVFQASAEGGLRLF